jgi:hypothetical protein
MIKQLAVATLAIAAASIVHAGEEQAYTGVAADAATTGAALATPGIAEMNPLGWATVPLRVAAIQYAKTLPREEGQPVMDAVSASGWGAAANNLLVLAGASAAAPVVGLAIGYAVWKSGEEEREFWEACAVHKQMDPNVKCEYKPWTREDVVRIAQQQQRLRDLARLNAPTTELTKVASAATQAAPAN